MKIKTIAIVLGMLLPILSIRAQDIKPLSIGDTIPDLVLHNVINYKDSVIRLSDFKGKLVILDFWATWCSGCQPLLRKLDTLQKELPDKFIPIIVSQDKSPYIVKNYLKKNRGTLLMQKPFVMCTDSLMGLFLHIAIPHEVIIGKDRVVKAITFEEFITKDNIQFLYQGQTLHTNLKHDLINYHNDQYLWSLASETPINYFNIVTPYISGIRGVKMHFYEDKAKAFRRFYAINRSIAELYIATFSILTNGFPQQLQIQFTNIADSMLYYQRALGYATDWQRRHTYAVDFVRPDFISNDCFKGIIRKELDLYFGWKSSVSEVYVNGYFLQPTKRQKLLPATLVQENPSVQTHSLKELLIVYNRANYRHPIFYPDSLNPFLESQRVPIENIQLSLEKLDSILHSHHLEKISSQLHYNKLTITKP